jgi:hypothetical protein
MNRITRITALAAASTIAVLAGASSANAAVSYDNNVVGSVDKQDVQDLFGWNDAALQNAAKNGGVTFTTGYNRVADNTLRCVTYVPGKGIVTTGSFHKIITTPVTQEVEATALTNPKGKVLRWNLDGFVGAATEGAATTELVGSCPSGSFDGGTLAQDFSDSPRILKVNGIALPKTPVAAPIA